MKPRDLDLVNRYIDGDLSDHDRAVLEERFESEPALRDSVNKMDSLLQAAGTLDVFRAPDVNLKRTSKFPTFFHHQRLGSFLAGAAVAAACIFMVVGLGTRPAISPIKVPQTQTFRMVYHAPGANSVSLLGDFNGWSGEIPLRPRGDKGYWLVEIPVVPGEYRYVLVVDGEKRTGDPLADYVIDDDFGSKNSVVRIGI